MKNDLFLMTSILATAVSFSVASGSEVKPQAKDRHPANAWIGAFSSGAKVERLDTQGGADPFMYQIIDDKNKVVCFAVATSSISCVKMP